MLSASTITTVKQTVPLLEEAGTGITAHFYQRMFRLNPELQNVFNMSNQRDGRQQFALFNAIATYAKHIDNLPALGAMVERIAHKHTSLYILPEQYDIVGHHLIETLREMVGEQFTPAVETAWREAYAFLAKIFIGREAELYRSNEQAPGGWLGPKLFKVLDKRPESELVSSFRFAPVDGGPVVDYKPGQYLGVRIKAEGAEYFEIRQYSLSDKANGESYRISVKREHNGGAGLVSNYLHDHLNVGDHVELLPPAGDFFLRAVGSPTVLISAGVGLTPMMSMLETIVDVHANTSVLFLHACENRMQHSFAARLEGLVDSQDLVDSYVWYNRGKVDAANNHFSGLMDLETISDKLPLHEGEYYLCGPVGFMAFVKGQLLSLGVGGGRIHYEVFGPHSDL
ncbi:NO-inducible flavohemoprotein [Microbulbifer hainanensis]|uniref:NO-inducible flavohemoprotein n=1 Tax=Microbulbifer hainanensis TaxID=2735675 RepID=UPI0018662C58|nr:NO-inducible flavohemoprotein [Microbulbifer hainanensis]